MRTHSLPPENRSHIARKRFTGPIVAVLALAALTTTAIVASAGAGASELAAGGWRTSATAPGQATVGSPVDVEVAVTANASQRALVDVEIYGPTGQRVHQQFWDNEAFTGTTEQTFTTTWTPASSAPVGAYRIVVGVFSVGWGTVYHWNNSAGALTVSGASSSPTPPTTPPITTPPVTATPAPPTTPASGDLAFVERFDNSGPTLVSSGGAMDRFDFGVWHRNLAVGYPAGHGGHWMADHDMNCGGVDTQHDVDASDVQGTFFLCRDHMMSTMGDVDGYTLAWFSPKQRFQDVSQVCWSVNLTDLLNRKWWEVAVVPDGTSPLIAIDWLFPNPVPLGMGPIPYSATGGVIAHWGPFSHKMGINGETSSASYDAGTDKATRYRHCLTDNGDGTVTFTQNRAGGAVASFTAKGSFPGGATRVVFKDHNYTPDKDGMPVGHTWHWDDIEVRTRS